MNETSERLAEAIRPVFWPHYPTVEKATQALLPVVEREIAAARAEAWDEGRLACCGIPPRPDDSPNPYRAALTEEGGDRVVRWTRERPVTGMDERLAKVAEVLVGHGVGQIIPLGHGAWDVTEVTGDSLAALTPLLDEFRAEDEARALRDAADKWQWGQWTALTPAVKAGSVIGAAQVVTDWLRDRAALGAGESDADCTCGYGGFHEPMNQRCERNIATGEPDAGAR